MKKPNLFIVGVPRSGTTSLYKYLEKHPSVYMSRVKGPNFFGEEINDAFPSYHKNKKRYLNLFSKADNYKVVGEASHLFNSKSAPKEIKKFNPSSKIIIILRDPLQIIRSTKGLKKLTKETLSNILNDKSSNSKTLWENLEYYKNVKRYINVFGKENVLIITSEDFFKDTKKIFGKICNFLGIESEIQISFDVHNPSIVRKNKWLSKGISKISPRLRVFIKSVLPIKFLDFLAKIVQKITTKKEIGQLLESEDVRKIIGQKYRKDYQKLKKLIGIDLNKKYFP